MTTMTRATLTPVLKANGQKFFADAGAIRQGRQRPIQQCDACKGYVVFVQSNAGKWYLADVFAYATDAERYFFRKDAPHFKTCADKATGVDAAVEQARFEAIDRQRAKAETAWIRHHMENGTWDQVTPEMLDAKIAEIAEAIK